MLRASAEAAATPLEPRAVTSPGLDPLIPAGSRLIDFVDAVLAGDTADAKRAAVSAAVGPDGLVDAAAVVGNFEMMNRIADATGMPVGRGTLNKTEEWRGLLGLDRFRH